MSVYLTFEKYLWNNGTEWALLSNSLPLNLQMGELMRYFLKINFNPSYSITKIIEFFLLYKLWMSDHL